MARYDILHKIEQLDAIADHREITYLSGFYDFPWDSTRALELALFRTFAVPSIGNLLFKTKEFTLRTQKRYDDTDLILAEILENGYESERAKEAFRRMNKMHTHYNISNDDMRYVLSTFVLGPYNWVNKFGYRQVTEKERVAAHQLWFEIGKRMGIKDIPESFEALEKYSIAYEQQHFAYSEDARSVADATLDLFLGWYLPKFTHAWFRPFFYAVMDEHLLNAFQYPKPSVVVVKFVEGIMGIRKRLLRLLPGRKVPLLRTTRKSVTYPNGYEIKNLGVERIK
jgi:hypothetical protein